MSEKTLKELIDLEPEEGINLSNFEVLEEESEEELMDIEEFKKQLAKTKKKTKKTKCEQSSSVPVFEVVDE